MCDIFFYDSVEEAEKIEDQINKKAAEFRDFGSQIHADEDKYLAGIKLMEQINEKYKKTPFPIYAYTSKGQYILDSNNWDRIIQAEARILPKNKLGREAERLEFYKGIKEYKTLHFPKWGFINKIWKVITGLGLMGAVIGFIITRLFS